MSKKDKKVLVLKDVSNDNNVDVNNDDSQVVNIDSKWIYKGKYFNEQMLPDDVLGFVYRVSHVASGKMYIGKKLFWSKVKKKPLKGMKRSRRSLKMSDWRSYCTSCTQIMELVERDGESAFLWEILTLHKSKASLNYEEARLQFAEEVLLSDRYFNGIINIRLGKSKNIIDQ